jgi:futalosine hydrolase
MCIPSSSSARSRTASLSVRLVTLLIAATKEELCGNDGLVCGIGPVEAAAVTARVLAIETPEAVLHAGIAGARGVAPGTIVVGTHGIYCDLAADVLTVSRIEPDQKLVAAVRAELPDALALPIGTSASVSGPCRSAGLDLRVEAMEGFAVLRACALAGVRAVEVRAISNEIGEDDRSRWAIGSALGALSEVLPSLLAALGE